MWICFNNGFVSTVENRNDKSMLIARARRRHHLEQVFPDRVADIFTLPDSDYKYRLNISKADYAKLVADRIMTIDYDNFKNSVDDHELHGMYARFWSVGYSIQR